jgi:hypothetical protein
MRVERPWILLEGGIRMEQLLVSGPGTQVPQLATLHSDERPPICGDGVIHRLKRERCQVLGLLPRGSWHLEFRTEVEQNILDAQGHRIPGPRLWSGVFGFDVESVESVDEAVPPDRDDRWARVLRSGLHVVPSKPNDERQLAWIQLELEQADWPSELQSDFEVELLCAGVSLGTCRIGPIDFPEPPEFRLRRSTLLAGLPWPVACGNASSNGWSVRICGVRGDALYDWEVERWWAGEFEVPLADLIRR